MEAMWLVLYLMTARPELIYIQSHIQRQCFEKFSELIMVDGILIR